MTRWEHAHAIVGAVFIFTTGVVLHPSDRFGYAVGVVAITIVYLLSERFPSHD